MENDIQPVPVLDDIRGFVSSQYKIPPMISEVFLGTGYSGVLLNNGHAGIAINLQPEDKLDISPRLRSLIGVSAFDGMLRVEGQSASMASVGLGTLSALSQPFIQDKMLARHGIVCERGDFGRVVVQEVRPSDRVVIVGYGGIVGQVMAICPHVTVTELQVGQYHTWRIGHEETSCGPPGARLVWGDEVQEALDAATVVIITGATLVNGTFHQIVEQCPRARRIVYGATASLWPLPLFHYGIDVITTIRIIEGEQAMEGLMNWGFRAELAVRRYATSIVLRQSIGRR